jgi:sulfur dioxygenase
MLSWQSRFEGDPTEDPMRVRQLLNPKTRTFTYLLCDPQTRDAVLVDPAFDHIDRDIELMQQLRLKLQFTVDTRLHTSHVTASGPLRARLGSRMVVPEAVQVPRADVFAQDGETIAFGRQALEVRHTPGAADLAMILVSADSAAVFAGDSMPLRGTACARPLDAEALWYSLRDKLYTLPDTAQIFPGRACGGLTCSTVGEEKAYNPLFGGSIPLGVTLDLCAGLPAQELDEAVLERNRRAGWAAEPEEARGERYWAPIRRTATGIPEVTTAWAAEHATEARVVDVRTVEEVAGDLGYIAGSENVPLNTLADAAADWNRQVATIVVCRSGGRSGRAAQLLEAMGFVRVASMRGGMLSWAREELPVAGL